MSFSGIQVRYTLIMLAGMCCVLSLSCSQNIQGIQQPPPPGGLDELFGTTLVSSEGIESDLEMLAGKDLIAIYFSAQWCPPCRVFTPLLVNATRELKKAGASFEVVFVSSDRSRRDMLNYMQEYEMPWPALPHGSETAGNLSRRYGVRGIPTLIVIDNNGGTVSMNARDEVARHGADAYKLWMQKERERNNE